MFLIDSIGIELELVRGVFLGIKMLRTPNGSGRNSLPARFSLNGCCSIGQLNHVEIVVWTSLLFARVCFRRRFIERTACHKMNATTFWDDKSSRRGNEVMTKFDGVGSVLSDIHCEGE